MPKKSQINEYSDSTGSWSIETISSWSPPSNELVRSKLGVAIIGWKQEEEINNNYVFFFYHFKLAT